MGFSHLGSYKTKSKRKLAILHENVANQHRGFVNKTALYFARKYNVIVLEDINFLGVKWV